MPKKRRNPSIEPIRFYLEPYPVELFFTRDPILASSIAEEEFLDEDVDFHSGTFGLCLMADAQVLVFVSPNSDDALATLHHEAIHAALYTLDLVGIDARSNHGECLTYLSESIFRKLKDKL